LYRQESPHFAEARNEHDAFTGVWSLAHIRQVHATLARRSPKTRLVIGGWGGGPQLPPVLRGLDRALPADIVFSCLNPGMGANGHAPVLAEIARRRPTWSIPWFEGDGWLWHLQLRAASISDQVKAAHADKLAGVVGIHWRTEEIRQNLEAFALTARDPAHAPSAEELYRQHCVARYGPESAAELAPLLLRFETEKELGSVSSPEFYPYDPKWGRISPALAAKLRDAIALLDRLKSKAPAAQHRANLDWLADNFRFTLLLDEVGRKLEPAYVLKSKSLLGETADAETARRELAAAPIAELFRTFARRVRSRGELGELSALNQKLWLQYRELDQFLKRAEVKR
jgi:hypothetical protein